MSLPGLPPGEFVLVQGCDAGPFEPVTFVPVPRETTHARHLRKYADGGVPVERRFSFRRPQGELAATADSLTSFGHALAAIDDAVGAFHAERGDFSRWVLDVLSDPTPGQQFRKTEARWRRGEIRDLRAAMERLVAARYGSFVLPDAHPGYAWKVLVATTESGQRDGSLRHTAGERLSVGGRSLRLLRALRGPRP
jgi:hypothetical protein